MVTTVGGIVAYGVCLGTGFQISYWLGGLARKAAQYVKERLAHLAEAVKVAIMRQINKAYLAVDEIAAKYPDLNWTEQARLKLAQLFARVAFGTRADQFMQYVADLSASSREHANE